MVHFCISFFHQLIRCIKKQNIPQDAAWKALQFTKNSFFFSCTFCFQNEQNSETLILFILRAMGQLENKLFFVICRAFHAASCGIFCFFFLKRSKWCKNEMEKGTFFCHLGSITKIRPFVYIEKIWHNKQVKWGSYIGV